MNWESGGKHRKGGKGGDARYRMFKKSAKQWFMRLLRRELKAEEEAKD